MTPTLTLNAGLRWDVQLPFTPVTDTYSTSTLEDLCGISGLGDGPGGRTATCSSRAAQTGDADPDVRRVRRRATPAFNTNWTNFAPNVGVAWRPNVQDGFLRTLLGDPEQATLRAGYSMSYNRERIDRFTGNATAPTRAARSAPNRNTSTGYPARAAGRDAGRCCFRETSRLGAAGVPADAGVSDRGDVGEQRQHLRPGPRTPRVALVLGRLPALDRHGHGDRSPLRRQPQHVRLGDGELERARTSSRTASSTSSSWRRPTCAANVAAGRGSDVRLHRRAPGTSPLPIYLAYLSGRRGRGQSGALHGDATSPTRRSSAASARSSPTPRGAADGARHDAAFRANALSGRPARRTSA